MSKKQERGLMQDLAEFFFPSESEAEDIKSWLLGKTVPCFLCKRELDIRFSKKNRPYTVCTECQTQTFIRGSKGLQRLAVFVKRQEG